MATYDGDANAAASTSESQATKVATRVVAKSKNKRYKTKVYGKVTPNKAGQTVRLYRVKRGRYVSIAKTTVRPRGRYVFLVKLPQGKSRLKVRVAAGDGNAAGATRLVVRRR